jgi:hypothetical protein|tara:strand:- start:2772 stop:3092 length:321 start_codon:yes stop_codon:yes gene_type:complete
VEIFLYLSIILIGGLGFCLGSLFSPRIKTLKADLKYTEGKLHRERQNNKEAQQDQGFDLTSLLNGGGLSDIIKLVKDNPDVIKNVLGNLGSNNPPNNQNNSLSDLR